jgi:predicted cupin superfamily sugar epimerase
MPALPDRAAELIRLLGLQPHPEGGHYAEVFRSPRNVQPDDGRGPRRALTSIDFLLAEGGFSAWHRVASDEAWHLLEGGPLRLWLAAPALDAFTSLDLAAVHAHGTPRHVVPAGWWQAAEPLAGWAYVGATVGPGFEFADFDFGRDDAALRDALVGRAPELMRLL